jgi:nucleoid-associated protein YgaU
VAPRTPDEPVLALAAPGKPDVAPPKPIVDGAATTDLAIGAVKGEAGGAMYISGRAAPSMRVNLYLNDAYIASATASADGRVAFSIQSGIRPGDYRVRLDQLDTSGRVQKRVEVPFKAPAMLAAASAPPKAQPSKPDAAPSTSTAAASAGSNRVAPPAAARGRPAAEEATPVGETRVAAGTSAGEETKAAGGTSAAGEKRIAGETTRPAPSESTSRIASTAPAADPNAAAPQPAPEPKVTPAPLSDASAPVRQPPPPPPAASEPAASQQPASRQAATEQPASQQPASQQPASQQPAPESTPPPPAPTPSAEKNGEKSAASASVVVIPHVETTVVTRGDSLWRISESTYGQGVRYPTIYNANRDNIRDPDLIYPGQIFVLPKDGP